MVKVVLAQKLMRANNDLALSNRELLKAKGVIMLNLISGPGAGKTTLLEKTLPFLAGKFQVGVIEGDIFTTRDADRIAKTGVEVLQINTSGACHLDAGMISEALRQLPLDVLDFVIIENVGNLVCPAEFDLGEDFKIVLSSVAEGMDKPAKYPLAFREAAAALITKTDLLSYIDFDMCDFTEQLRQINSNLKIIPVSAIKNEGMTEWINFIETLLKENKSLKA